MAPKRILILGGYGSTGAPLARLLLRHADAQVILGGRNPAKAGLLLSELRGTFGMQRVSTVSVDASSFDSLVQALQGMDMVIVASSTTQYVRQIAEAALQAGVDYLDVQYSPEKVAILRTLEPQIRQAGRCFITDGGFHPGLPGFLVRYASLQLDALGTARVGSVIKQDWKHFQVGDEAIAELVELINDFEMLVYKGGCWKKASLFSTADLLTMDFGKVFGRQYCFPMMLEEMRGLPERIPTLTDTGFYVGGFNWFVDWIVMPVTMLAVKISPRAAVKPMGRWMHWGLKAFSKPPYGTLLRVEASGTKDGAPKNLAITIAHPDGYLFTAIPVAACLLQYLDGSITEPGLWFQALVVEPRRFMTDLQRMGISVDTGEWRRA